MRTVTRQDDSWQLMAKTDDMWEDELKVKSWASLDAARQKRVIAVWALVCIMLVGVFYWPVIFTGYRDTPGHDEWQIINAVSPYGVVGAYRYFGPSFWQHAISPEYVYYRPVALFSHAVDYCLWGTNPYPAHAINIALHMVNVVLLGWLVALLVGNWLPGMLAAVLYALLPTHAEPVCWVAARMDVLCGAFSLASMLALILAQRRSSRALVAVGVAFFLLAIGAKEPGGALVLVVVLWALTAEPGTRRLPLAAAAVFMALGAGYIGMRYFAGTIIEPPQRHPFRRLGFRFHAYYLSRPLTKVYEAIQTRSVLWMDWLGLARGAAKGILLWPCFRAAGLLLLWRIAFYLPALILVQADDRYLYVPEMGSAGLMGLIVWQAALWLRRCHEHLKWVALAAYAWVLGESVYLLLLRLSGWKSL
ncbi:MAG: hypothetical protein JSV65_14605 [Armatimonadota bacterium]|nr:MAG: hypothetical protein JSV65_14605 [Armatimonadota bacterium]